MPALCESGPALLNQDKVLPLRREELGQTLHGRSQECNGKHGEGRVQSHALQLDKSPQLLKSSTTTFQQLFLTERVSVLRLCSSQPNVMLGFNFKLAWMEEHY